MSGRAWSRKARRDLMAGLQTCVVAHPFERVSREQSYKGAGHAAAKYPRHLVKKLTLFRMARLLPQTIIS